ncbi:MAG: hypothetical protein GY791_02430 [Alphaproteobacteria bacterium]|nr:hypothetical protein [Alphaproteobacteria bacterium]
MRGPFLSLFAITILAGCAGPSAAAPEFDRAAYSEGCLAGTQVGGFSNNYVATNPGPSYESDPHYRQSWDAGFRKCFDRAIANPRRR